MRKLFAWGLPDETEAAPETRTFSDPRHPGEEFALCLSRPGLLEEAAIAEVAEHYCGEYLPEKGQRKPFLSPSGKTYPLNRAAIWEVSAVYCLQGGPAAERYQWVELLAVYLKRGRLWRQASAWAGALLDEERQSLGEDEEAAPPGFRSVLYRTLAGYHQPDPETLARQDYLLCELANRLALLLAAMGGPLLPEIEPDTRQGWVEKWLLLAAEDAAREREADDEPSANGMASPPAVDEIIRRLGAVERGSLR